MEPRGNNYNNYAKEYAEYIERLEADEVKGETDRIVEAVLHYAGDISGLEVLDAGCGEGYMTRKLVGLGAKLTAHRTPQQI